jgi:hypothetical protein
VSLSQTRGSKTEAKLVVTDTICWQFPTLSKFPGFKGTRSRKRTSWPHEVPPFRCLLIVSSCRVSTGNNLPNWDAKNGTRYFPNWDAKNGTRSRRNQNYRCDPKPHKVRPPGSVLCQLSAPGPETGIALLAAAVRISTTAVYS